MIMSLLIEQPFTSIVTFDSETLINTEESNLYNYIIIRY